MKEILSKTADQTLSIGRCLGRSITGGISISLRGDLGAGKTTFVQGLARGLGVSKDYYITSPTFSIINEYDAGHLALFHMDLYRLGSEDELSYLGFEDLLHDRSVIVVEWPLLLEQSGYRFDLDVRFSLDDQFNRTLCLTANERPGRTVLEQLDLDQ